ncbi:MAG: GNAT superfamily N-acetyltransferase [Bradymonadia bacterium]|jgi:GNAT superfamily N-acetyltransferase
MNPIDIEQNWAEQQAAFTLLIAEREPSWGSRVFELAGGYAVLAGKGLFVNRAVGVAMQEEMRAKDFGRLEQASATVGVPSAIEITPLTSPGVIRTARDRGYRPATTRTVFAQNLGWAESTEAGRFVVRTVDGSELVCWQKLAACAFGATASVARQASDTYAAVSFELQEDQLLIASIGGEDVACASLTIRGGIATLGGMGTVPEFRRRGAQLALIRVRLALAIDQGCSWATSSAVTDGSKRNLVRAGFEPIYEQVTWVRSTTQR